MCLQQVCGLKDFAKDLSPNQQRIAFTIYQNLGEKHPGVAIVGDFLADVCVLDFRTRM